LTSASARRRISSEGLPSAARCGKYKMVASMLPEDGFHENILAVVGRWPGVGYS